MQAGNDRYDLERAEQQAKEKARAHIRFEQIPSDRKADETAGLEADAVETPSSTFKSESSEDSSVLATEPPLESAKEHAVTGLEHAPGVHRGSMARHGHKRDGKPAELTGKVSKEGKAEKRKRKKRKIVEGVEEPKGEDVPLGEARVSI